MARKRYKPEEIVAKLRQVEVLVSQGQNMVDAIRQIGVRGVTYYRWRQGFGGLKTEQVKRLKDLVLEMVDARDIADVDAAELVRREESPEPLPRHTIEIVVQRRLQGDPITVTEHYQQSILDEPDEPSRFFTDDVPAATFVSPRRRRTRIAGGRRRMKSRDGTFPSHA